MNDNLTRLATLALLSDSSLDAVFGGDEDFGSDFGMGAETTYEQSYDPPAQAPAETPPEPTYDQVPQTPATTSYDGGGTTTPTTKSNGGSDGYYSDFTGTTDGATVPGSGAETWGVNSGADATRGWSGGDANDEAWGSIGDPNANAGASTGQGANMPGTNEWNAGPNAQNGALATGNATASDWDAGALTRGQAEPPGAGAANTVDADRVLKELPLPEPVTPTFTEADLRQDAAPRPQEESLGNSKIEMKSADVMAANAAAAHRVDIAQNYRDAASPPELYQTSNIDNRATLDNCSIVSTLNQVASTPEGQAHLASRVESLGDGFHRVTLNNADGTPNPIVVREPDAGVGTNGDANLRIFERAIAVSRGGDLGSTNDAELYNNISKPAWPSQTMTDLGLTSPSGTGNPHEVLGRRNSSFADTTLDANVATLNSRTGPMEYGLVPQHAYQVTSSYQDPETRERMVVLTNPHGHDHPQPIPESRLRSLFDTSSVGRIPRR